MVATGFQNVFMWAVTEWGWGSSAGWWNGGRGKSQVLKETIKEMVHN
jgi:hypothetical protein